MILGNTVESIGDDGFTIIVLPDTQHYVQKDKYPETLKCFESQIQWIIENREKLNIVFVSHVGVGLKWNDLNWNDSKRN